ncbi:MAG: alpha/beta hydrolase fold domain-containing protein [Myxococcota bacterium]
MSTKKYPFSDDFDDLSRFSLDMSSDLRLRLTNFLMGTQYRYRSPDEHVQKTTHTIEGYQGHKLTIDVLTPKRATEPLPWVYYSHGGGFLMDLLPAHMDICSEYAARANCVVVIPHYRVAIRDPFPISVEDCYAGLKWAIENAASLGLDLSRLALAGESAGGALTASLSQIVRDRSLTEPLFQMLIYPVTSNRLDSDSMVNMPDAPVWGAENARKSWSKYLQGHDTPPKYASPLETEDFSGLPPAYIEPCEFDVLRDEGVAYAHRLREAGIPVELNVTKGTIHAFDLNRDSAITQDALSRRVRALRQAFARVEQRITLLIHITVQPGEKDTVVKYFEGVARNVRSEPGTNLYTWSFDSSGERAVIIEQYADVAAFLRHMEQTDTREVALVASFERVSVCGMLPEALRESLKERLDAKFYAPLGGITNIGK